MNQSLIIFEELPDAWRRNVHGVVMTKEEYDLSCEIDASITDIEKSVILNAISLGLKLRKFKHVLGKGRFGKWRREKFGEKDKTCQRSMLLAKHFGNCSQAISHLSQTLTLKMLAKDNWKILENEIMSDIGEKRVLIADKIDARLLEIETHRPQKNLARRHVAETNAETVIVAPSANEIRAIEHMATLLGECDDDTLSIVLRMESFRIGEMLIDRLLSAEH